MNLKLFVIIGAVTAGWTWSDGGAQAYHCTGLVRAADEITSSFMTPSSDCH